MILPNNNKGNQGMGNVSLSAALKKNRRKNNLAFTRRNWTNISKCSLFIFEFYIQLGAKNFECFPCPNHIFHLIYYNYQFVQVISNQHPIKSF